MALDIFFKEDIQDRLDSLRQTNERLLTLAEDLGADARDIGLIRAVIMDTLDAVGVSFGLYCQRLGFVATLQGKRFPVVMDYTLSDGGSNAPETGPAIAGPVPLERGKP